VGIDGLKLEARLWVSKLVWKLETGGWKLDAQRGPNLYVIPAKAGIQRLYENLSSLAVDVLGHSAFTLSGRKSG
jgi:hypothetical protein